MEDLHPFLRGLSWLALAIAAVFFLVLVVLFWIVGADVLWRPSVLLLAAALLLRGLAWLARLVRTAVGEGQASGDQQAG